MFCRNRWLFSALLTLLSLLLGSQPAWCADIYAGMPAALDQPHINVLLKTTPTGTPIQDTDGFGLFNIDAYLDTGASGIMLSQETTSFLGLQSKLAQYPNSSGIL